MSVSTNGPIFSVFFLNVSFTYFRMTNVLHFESVFKVLECKN